MEIAADYGMSYEDAFDIIESAQNNNLISSYFNNFQNQNSIYQLNNHNRIKKVNSEKIILNKN